MKAAIDALDIVFLLDKLSQHTQAIREYKFNPSTDNCLLLGEFNGEFKDRIEAYTETLMKLNDKVISFNVLNKNEQAVQDVKRELEEIKLRIYNVENKIAIYNANPQRQFHSAAYSDDVPKLELLLNNAKESAKYFSRTNPAIELLEGRLEGKSALYLAAENGQHKAVAYLYENGAKIDTCGPGESSAFVAAAKHNHTEVIKTILDIRGKSKVTSSMQRKIQEKGTRNTALHYAAENGNYDMMAAILNSTSRFYETYDQFGNITNMNGETPLHILAKKGYHEIIQKLDKQFGLNKVFKDTCHLSNHNLKTPIELAVDSDNLDTAKMLKALIGYGGVQTAQELVASKTGGAATAPARMLFSDDEQSVKSPEKTLTQKALPTGDVRKRKPPY